MPVLETVVINSKSSTPSTVTMLSLIWCANVLGISLKIPLRFFSVQNLVPHNQIREFWCYTWHFLFTEVLLMLGLSPQLETCGFQINDGPSPVTPQAIHLQRLHEFCIHDYTWGHTTRLFHCIEFPNLESSITGVFRSNQQSRWNGALGCGREI
jgi:hypothetical protein